MPRREILLYPDPFLRRRCRPAEPGSPEVEQAVQDLWDTLDSHVGVGLAAPQIGYDLRVIVVDASRARRPVPHHGRIALVNPEIVLAEGEVVFREGCLSIPDLVAYIRRAGQVTVAGFLPEGRRTTLIAEGFEAVVFQHEIDHLDGILFIDRVHRARDLQLRGR